MFRMAYKDLRISPLRTFLTGFSMFIGIIAMILAVLVGTLGKESLLSTNAQLFGYSPTYSISVIGSNFSDTDNVKRFIKKLKDTRGKTVLINPSKELKFAPMNHISQFEDSIQLYKRISNAEIIYTISSYNEIYNLPMFEGKWLSESKEYMPLEVVVNKQWNEAYHSKYVVSSGKDTLNLTGFNVVGVVNDGKGWPVIYVNVESMLSYIPNIFNVDNATIYWHDGGELTTDKIRSHINDILTDTIGGQVENISRTDSGEQYLEVIRILQIGLIISAALLLFVAILGQINIGLSSLEQRTHELLIRRALGASKLDIALLVLSSIMLLSIVICLIAIIISALMVYLVGMFLPVDSPIYHLTYPVLAAVIAVITSIVTALLGGLMPAIKASKLEPALALR
ncbi:peptide ABC transporter permease [Streptococcus equi subsp. zooepidemicus Sz4is]|uniref:Peptide ABC transporter permease n=2 Tax=Streptococcus equi TaxID=1336 RepID=A0AAW3GJL2_STRSZ|nr:peptide ABC transporter permease [Streptococcus equi subsp. zooepidemicus Sz4is]